MNIVEVSAFQGMLVKGGVCQTYLVSKNLHLLDFRLKSITLKTAKIIAKPTCNKPG